MYFVNEPELIVVMCVVRQRLVSVNNSAVFFKKPVLITVMCVVGQPLVSVNKCTIFCQRDSVNNSDVCCQTRNQC